MDRITLVSRYCPGSVEKVKNKNKLNVTLTYGWGWLDSLIRKGYHDIFEIDLLGKIELQSMPVIYKIWNLLRKPQWDGFWPQWAETFPLPLWTIWQDIGSPVSSRQKQDQWRPHLRSHARSPFGSIRSLFEVGLNICEWLSNTDKWRRN